jgi:hypothetical protein
MSPELRVTLVVLAWAAKAPSIRVAADGTDAIVDAA